MHNLERHMRENKLRFTFTDALGRAQSDAADQVPPQHAHICVCFSFVLFLTGPHQFWVCPVSKHAPHGPGCTQENTAPPAVNRSADAERHAQRYERLVDLIASCYIGPVCQSSRLSISEFV